MFLMLLVILFIHFHVAVVAQSPLSAVCVAGQCIQGMSGTSIGARLSRDSISLQLLPGQYTSTTNPQLLHDLLTSRSSTLVGLAGFQSAVLSPLPLNLRLDPGVAIYSQTLYSGQGTFSELSESLVNTSIVGKSIAISPNVWMTVSINNNRFVLWDSVPDTSQLPSTGPLTVLDIQSSACNPPCAGSSFCSEDGTCTCPTGFTGSSCETCQEGFFGPTCQPCPQDCEACDQGISGTGRCSTIPNNVIDDLPATCDCINGLCGADGQCTCNKGWIDADNGTACAQCAPGTFLLTGECRACQLGCSQCADDTGVCISCMSGFTPDKTDQTKCVAVRFRTSIGFLCWAGSFAISISPECITCNNTCSTCLGPYATDCTGCAPGSYFFNHTCVKADGDGICQGTNGMIANNEKNSCEIGCGAKCTSCKIPNFDKESTIAQLQCTGCLPGSFLIQGKCMTSCPEGMFMSPQDFTCTACSSSCSTCSDSPDFCETCRKGRVVFEGKCVSACPSNTFSSSGSCTRCHPDCLTCSGPDFNQCRSCLPSRPVLTDGRCQPICSKSEFFDAGASSCQACDTSCSSCSGRGPRNCLACSSASQVLRGGSCVSANCENSTSVIPGLGVCLSELVEVLEPFEGPSTSTSTSTNTRTSVIPLPTITGLTDPTVTTVRQKPTWWQILLMTLGCVFLFLVFLMCFRRRARKQREKRTQDFAREKSLDELGWRKRFLLWLFRNREGDSRFQIPRAHDRDSLDFERTTRRYRRHG